MSSLRDPYEGPGFRILPKERLLVIHRRQRLADAMGRPPWCVVAYYAPPKDVCVLFLEYAGG